MKLAFYINYLNHHQVFLADAFFKALGKDFVCISTMPMKESELKGDKDFSNREYCIDATYSIDTYNTAMTYARDADICIFGADSYEFAVERARHNHTGLSFEVGERWLKRGYINILSPKFLKWLYLYYKYFHKSNFYRLCASAFAANDVNLVGAYKNKCFRWGYFIRCTDIDSTSSTYVDSRYNIVPRIMWCARFIKFKHPELPVKLAARLKHKGYRFMMDLFGSGKELEATKRLAKKLDVEDIVNFAGARQNDEIQSEMRKHDIFLFTSDKQEGWGVVLNESMVNGSVAVCSDEVGAAPYLLDDGNNGYIFEAGNLDSLEAKVADLLNNPQKCRQMAVNAYLSMNNHWSPEVAVKQFLLLVSALNAKDFSILPTNGPASKIE